MLHLGFGFGYVQSDGLADCFSASSVWDGLLLARVDM